MSRKRILAADIGGTNARFAAAAVDETGRVELGEVFQIDTKQPGVSSFSDFWARFTEEAPGELADSDTFDAVSLAVAGPVNGQSAELTNIDWNIRAEETGFFKKLFLLNDFLAQGHALAIPGAMALLETIREGKPDKQGVIALIGAGTGLGHCALHPRNNDSERHPSFLLASSEAGHAIFPFIGPEERELERAWLDRTDKRYLSNDDVVSGRGVVNLHTCLTGKTLPAGEALGDPDSETSRLFSRFYGRACMNYCLSVFPVRCLVISGGVAARNPHLIGCKHFFESFGDAKNYEPLLSRIPIMLNTNQQFGIKGAASFAASQIGKL